MRPLVLALTATVAAEAYAGIRVIESAEESGDRLAEKGTVQWSTTADSSKYSVSVDPDTTFQTIVGFGGAFTDSSASVFAKLNATMQAEVVNAFWGENGQRYNMARVPIGATDFSTSVYVNHHRDYTSPATTEH